MGHPHPIIRRIPGSGQEALFLGRRTNAYVVGLPLEESERLLEELWRHATQPQFCHRHQWRLGQVVVWDNRMLLHMRHPLANGAVRFMWRTQTRGEVVLPAGV
jgi:taurine dioxygenase